MGPPIAVTGSEAKVSVADYPKTKTFDATRDNMKPCQKLMQVKNIQEMLAEHEGSELKRSLGAFELTMLGIGEIVGTGIFVLTGTAAANNAGPAVVLSFMIAVSLSLCLSDMKLGPPLDFAISVIDD